MISLTSKLITCVIDGSTFEMKSQSIVYLLGEVNIYIYEIWTLKVKCTQYAFLWTSGLQECKDILFLEIGLGGGGQQFLAKIINF